MKVQAPITLEHDDLVKVKTACRAAGLTFTEYVRLALDLVGGPTPAMSEFVLAKKGNKFGGTFLEWLDRPRG